MNTEHLTKAAHTAALLVADLRDAHKAACGDSHAERLAEAYLRQILGNAAALAATLKSIAP